MVVWELDNKFSNKVVMYVDNGVFLEGRSKTLKEHNLNSWEIKEKKLQHKCQTANGNS